MQKHSGGAVVALLALALALAGCSDGSDGGSGANDTITDDGSFTPTAITASDLENTKWTSSYMDTDDGETYYTATMTIEFKSNGEVAVSGTNGSDDNSYTYTTSGSTVAISYDNGEEFMKLTNFSGNLVEVGVVYTLDGSSSSGSAISLAGTTWSYRQEYGTDYAYVGKLEFGSGGNVATYFWQYAGSEILSSNTTSGTYTTSGSTVAISADGLELQLGYSSGQLLYIQKTFTKD